MDGREVIAGPVGLRRKMIRAFSVSTLLAAMILSAPRTAGARQLEPDEIKAYTAAMVSLVETFCLALDRKENAITEAVSNLNRSPVTPDVDGEYLRWNFTGPAAYRIQLQMKKGLRNAYCRLTYSGGDPDVAQEWLGGFAKRFTEQNKMTSRVFSFGAGRADDLGSPVRSWMHEARGGPFGPDGGLAFRFVEYDDGRISAAMLPVGVRMISQ